MAFLFLINITQTAIIKQQISIFKKTDVLNTLVTMTIVSDVENSKNRRIILSHVNVIQRHDVLTLYLQESLANAMVSARQQCVYEGPTEEIYSRSNDMRFPIDG